ncbi:MAG TPA: zf-TFIIB domain-containing protein [Castellaniella sp.]|nr:zf-TFIIB domain-containing protein [Castellaniella sp.]
MKCPVCPEVNLTMSTRQNIEIDYCPQCRGVWLDRGELDKLIERTVQEMPVAPAPSQRSSQPQQYYGDSRHHHRKKSFWHEIFD